jgi:hypothetical protein
MAYDEARPLVEDYIEKGRELYTRLEGEPTPDEIGLLYDDAGTWEAETYRDLEKYHENLAEDFRRGGGVLSPSFSAIHPTDASQLEVFIRRRGQVLRNFLDGTPGKGLEWPENQE